jgi:hypothetical protein
MQAWMVDGERWALSPISLIVGGVAVEFPEACDHVDDPQLLWREVVDGWLGGDDLVAQWRVWVGSDVAEPQQHLERGFEPLPRGPQRTAGLVGRGRMVPLLGDLLEEPEDLPVEGVRTIGHMAGS